MLLTPHIVRTHELTARDLGNIYIGTQSNMSLGGPPPLIGGIAEPPADVPVNPAPPPAPGAVQLQVPPGTSPIPGLTAVPAPAPPPAGPPAGAATAPPTVNVPAQPPGVTATPTNPPATIPTPTPANPNPPATQTPPVQTAPAPTTTAPPAPARVVLSAPPEMRVGAGPYTVPVSISGASRLSTITLSINYNPAVVRVRNVQEGSFMRQGGINAAFSQQVDPAAGRVDIVITRPGDQVGAAGTGLLAAVLFEPVAAGSVTFMTSGVGAMAGGGTPPLTFAPATVIVK
jgi:hypothetical protein